MLAVISNFDSRLVPILDGLGAGAWFGDIFVSSRVGYAKPHRQIFRAALARHGLPPEHALHVGDSETNDLRGAQNAGLNALLVDRSLQANGPVEDRIASLQEIVSRIDR
jgi:putative hydrolase of the HAD superfamily